ncbi:MAG: leucine-rich repeat domain-containing protein [Oscillospiraceae bacterium]|nr:leucine-rich repeat domain-containing protein [Oscillospiraceae bacterium]
MKKIKALLAGITALSCLCANCLPMAEQIPPLDFVIACAEEIATSGTCGKNLTWNFDTSTGTLTISGTGTMDNWDKYPDWHDFDSDMKKIILKNGVTTIGSNAFSYCTALTSITIPDSVTAIEEGAFSYCESLASVTIPDSVITIGSHAFFGCTALKSITIPDSVTAIGRSTFDYCTALESITIPDSVTAIGENAFNCTALKSIIIPDSVTTIEGSAFFCTPWLETKQKENPFVIVNGILINGTTCKGEIRIPDSVTAIGGHAFYGSSLTSITIPDSVTTIGGSAFFGTPWLKTKQNENPLVIVNGILIDGTTCEGEIRIPDSVTTIGSHAFSYCAALESIIIPDSVKSIEKNAFSDCPALESIIISNSVTTIGDGAFACCSALTSVTIPDSVTSIGECAFYNCESLTSITIENPACQISEDDCCGDAAIFEPATIYGYDNSSAQTYAEKYHINFVSLGTAPAPTDTSTTWNGSNTDMNGDDRIDTADAVLILVFSAEYGAGKVSSFAEFMENYPK